MANMQDLLLNETDREAFAIWQKFAVADEVREFKANYGNGHINDTYLVKGVAKDYILQRINPFVFPAGKDIMDNIAKILPVLKVKSQEQGLDPERHTLTLLPTKEGAAYYVAADGAVWRVYLFIKDTVSFELVNDLDRFEQAGRAFGEFQRCLAEFSADDLVETIKHFHDTVKRYTTFKEALAADVCDRAAEPKAASAIAFALSMEDTAAYLMQALAAGKLPLRVTHNDTKINNILFDKQTLEPLCVVDLDTVMPGLAAFDFGDAIRSGASTALEDEQDLSKVHFSMEHYRAFSRGFIKALAADISRFEAQSLAHGALIITLETGVRFLTDYLQGDVYFKTAYPEHNLVRTATQFKLVREMQENFTQMQDYAVQIWEENNQ